MYIRLLVEESLSNHTIDPYSQRRRSTLAAIIRSEEYIVVGEDVSLSKALTQYSERIATGAITIGFRSDLERPNAKKHHRDLTERPMAFDAFPCSQAQHPIERE